MADYPITIVLTNNVKNSPFAGNWLSGRLTFPPDAPFPPRERLLSVCGFLFARAWRVDIMNKNPIDIVLAPDDNYAPHARAVIKSLLKFCSAPTRFWVLSGGLSKESRGLLKSAADRVEILDVDAGMFEGFPSNGYISVSTWYRFAIACILPDSVERALYLDCDVAVAADVAPLFDIDIDGRAVAAVKDCLWRKFDRRAGLPADFHYFNAGVLLINLKYWRASGVQERLFRFVGESKKNMNMLDQSVLNVVLKDEYTELPLCWNVQYLPAYIEESCYGVSEFVEAFGSPKIIHFVNRFKPWSRELGWLNPLNGYFRAFMENSVSYSDSKIRIFAGLIWRKFLRKPLFITRRDYWNNVRICRACRGVERK